MTLQPVEIFFLYCSRYFTYKRNAKTVMQHNENIYSRTFPPKNQDIKKLAKLLSIMQS